MKQLLEDAILITFFSIVMALAFGLGTYEGMVAYSHHMQAEAKAEQVASDAEWKSFMDDLKRKTPKKEAPDGQSDTPDDGTVVPF